MLKKELEQEIDVLNRRVGNAERRGRQFQDALDNAKNKINRLKGEVVMQKKRADRAEGYIERVREAEKPAEPEERRRLERRQSEPYVRPYAVSGRQVGKTGWAEINPEDMSPWYEL